MLSEAVAKPHRKEEMSAMLKGIKVVSGVLERRIAGYDQGIGVCHANLNELNKVVQHLYKHS